MWCPTFCKLKTLLLNEWCVAIDLQAIVCFLQHTPVLEKLILQLRKVLFSQKEFFLGQHAGSSDFTLLLCSIQAPKGWEEMKGNCSPSKRQFATKNLKLMKIKCGKFDKRVQNIFSILITYGLCIEEINVQRTRRCSECKFSNRYSL